jgi:hypothetical protein
LRIITQRGDSLIRKEDLGLKPQKGKALSKYRPCADGLFKRCIRGGGCRRSQFAEIREDQVWWSDEWHHEKNKQA